MPTKDKFSVVMKGSDEAEITLYDVIDGFWGISAAGIYEQLKGKKDLKTIRLRINSPGGSVFEGTAIYNLLKSHAARKVVHVDGVAASMASVIAMVGDEIEIGEGAYMMIHDPLGMVRGDADEMREMASMLDKIKSQIIGIYARRTGIEEATISQMMTDETWMTGKEAVESRFADRTAGGLRIAAVAPMTDFYNKVPDALRVQAKQEPEPTGEPKMAQETEKPRAATYHEIAAICGGDEQAFICAQLAANATADAAASAWAAELKKQRDEARQAAATAKAEADAARAEAEEAKAKAKSGVAPLGSPTGKQQTDNDPVSAFTAAVNAKISAGLAKPKAVAAVVRENPELHQAYLAAVNSR